MATIVAAQVLPLIPKLIERQLPFLLQHLDTSKAEAALHDGLQSLKANAPLSVPVFIDLWNRLNVVVQQELSSFVLPPPQTSSSWLGAKRRGKRTRRSPRNRK